MGQTRRVYPEVIAVLSLEDGGILASGHERKQRGDIIDVLPASHKGAGQRERKRFLWVRLSGLEEGELGRLGDNLDTGEKRFWISLADLADVEPRFDVSKAVDATQTHQTFVTLDTAEGWFLAGSPVYEATGLVRDRLTGTYI